MARWRAVFSVAAIVAFASGSPSAQTTGSPAAQQPSTRFRSAVDLVSVAAVVRDRKGRFVADLSREDFIVLEGGQRRPIVGFEAESDAPVKVAILFDVSGSMRGSKTDNARDAARHLLGALKGSDQAAVFSFDARLRRVRQFTSDFNSLGSSLDDVDTPYGQTSLYDAIAETARDVATAAAVKGKFPRRAAVVVLTDGVDTHSRLKPEEVSAIASEIDVPVYILTVVSSVDDPHMFDAPDEGAAGGLRDLAQWTGGELFVVSAPASTSVAARQIVSELRHQYLLAFEASPLRGWRSLEVKARGRDLTVRARSGYTAGNGVSDVPGR
jgi:VWFA-related protein